MNRLKGQTILIGKEPGQGRLMVALAGTGHFATIGSPGCVPGCVSRCRPAEGMAHARIAVDADGNMILTNAKPQNVTFVNGVEIASKRVLPSHIVELGKDHFRIDLNAVTATASGILASGAGQQPQPQQAYRQQPAGNNAARQQAAQPKRFNIAHLERVWEGYQGRRREIQDAQRKINLIRSGCGLFTMCAMPCIFFFGPVGYVLTAIGVIGNLYSFFGMKNSNTAERLEQLTEEFQDMYVCPNPDCNKYLGNMRYKLLKKQYSMHCPHCKCEYVEK